MLHQLLIKFGDVLDHNQDVCLIVWVCFRVEKSVRTKSPHNKSSFGVQNRAKYLPCDISWEFYLFMFLNSNQELSVWPAGFSMCISYFQIKSNDLINASFLDFRHL